MNIYNSPDITLLSVEVTWDISGSLPQINLLNQSTGSNLAGCTWAFTALSPSQTPIHIGNITDPDETGDWSTAVLNDAWPRPMNNIEFSGAPYQFYVTVRDSIGNEYTDAIQYASICRPVGNNQSSKNTYGSSSSDVKVQCQDAAIYFQDTTYHTYQGTDGTQISSVLRVIYPIDETLVIPDPFVAAQYVTALVPISYSSKNYQFVQTVIYDYEVGDNCLVRIRYQTIQTFAVYCNIDLLPLVCEINKLLDTVESGNCIDAPEAQRRMNLIVGKFSLVMIGIQQPLTGVDVPLLIDEIVAIGGFDCNCCSAPSGIIPTTSSVIGGYNFLINKEGGDINGSWSTNGQNITLNLSDVSYVVAIGNQSPSTISAFSVSSTVSGNGFLKTYYINIDGTQLAFDILNIIKGNTELVNLFNSIVIPGNFQLVVDMGCIGTPSQACDYEFTLSGISDAPTFSYIALIQSSIPANVRVMNYTFNLSTLPALQSYLNTLGIGTFVVTDLGGGDVSITTAANNFNLTGLAYSASGGNKKFALFSSDCTGFLALSANQVVQAIIDYLRGLDDSQLVTSQDYVVCSVDPSSNLKVMETVPSGTAENILLATILDAVCNTVDYILSINGITCASMKSLFLPSSNLMQSNDGFFGTVAGDCAIVNPVEAGTRIMKLGAYNPEFINSVGAIIDIWSGGHFCSPYTVYQLSVVDVSPDDNTMDIVVTFTHPDAISNTIRYARIDNTSTPVYTTIPNILPGASPYTISGVADGNYSVGITPIYADGRSCGEVVLQTGACTGITSFSAIFDGADIVVSYVANGSLPKVKVVIIYPNGGQASTIYTNDGMDITITPPSGNYGFYTIYMVPVCNETTGFEGVGTASVVLNVTPTSNSTFTNNTTNNLAPISMSAKNVALPSATIVFNESSVASGGGIINFYLEDGVYGNTAVAFATGTVGEAYLTSASGVMIGVVGSGVIHFNDGFTNSGGIQIVVIDASPES